MFIEFNCTVISVHAYSIFGGYPENSELEQTKGKQKPTIKPKPKSSCKNSEANRSLDQNIKHVTPPNGSDNVYAMVDSLIQIGID
jgi:hypothetical protein